MTTASALAQAEVGIAIGAGTDVAIESAGVILVSDRLLDVLNALILGKASYRTLTGNVVVAVVFSLVEQAGGKAAGNPEHESQVGGMWLASRLRSSQIIAAL